MKKNKNNNNKRFSPNTFEALVEFRCKLKISVWSDFDELSSTHSSIESMFGEVKI